MVRSTLPLFPSDEGWLYSDRESGVVASFGLVLEPGDEVAEAFVVTPEPDLDVLELRADPHVFDDLTELEHAAVVTRFGLGGAPAVAMRDLGSALGCGRSTARDALGTGIAKVRSRLLAP